MDKIVFPLKKMVTKITVDTIHPHPDTPRILSQCDNAKIIQKKWKKVKKVKK